MKIKVKDLDITSGGTLVAMLHEKEAGKLDFKTGDRLELDTGKKKTVVVLDVTSSENFVKPGEIGLFDEVMDKLELRDGKRIHMHLDKKPISLKHIKKKMEGKRLNSKETYEIIKDIVDGKLSDIELTYYVAANFMQSMDDNEIVALAKAMINTGEPIKIKGRGPVMDKHCIGGVPGNRTTLVVVPILLAAGLVVPKTSSRSITSPAGTADTMEVLCDVTMSMKKIIKVIDKTGGCMIWGGAVNLAPADDTMINVEHPLSINAEGQLLASILAKKGSVSANHVLIDIPVGKDAKLESMKKAKHLADRFTKIGKKLGMDVKSIVTDGSEPIGNGIGPALEARDLLWLFQRDRRLPKDLLEKSLEVAGTMLEMGKKAKKGKGRELAEELWKTGKAYKSFSDVVKAQGLITLDPKKIRIGKYKFNYNAKRTGKIRHMSNKSISKIARIAGCPKDKGAGIYLHKHKGEWVKKGDKLFTVYSESKTKIDFAKGAIDYVDGIIIK